ncbi:MAG: CHAT domain-containing protein [Cyanobacteria bacterium J06598_1]
MHRSRFRLRPRRSFLTLCACALFSTVGLGGFSPQASIAQTSIAQTIEVQSTEAQSTEVRELVQTGVDRYQAGDFVAAIAPWQAAYEVYDSTQDLSALAIVSENLARAYQQIGQTAEEIRYWEKAIAVAQRLENAQSVSRLMTEQAQAYTRLGQQRRAIAILCGSDIDPCEAGSALQLAEASADPVAQLAALGSLGEAYRLMGDGERSLAYLERGHTLSVDSGHSALQMAIHNSLANTSVSLAQVNYRRASEAQGRGDSRAARPLQAKAEAFNTKAIENFQQSYQLAVAQADVAGKMRSLLGLIPAYERMGSVSAAQQQRAIALTLLADLPDSLPKAFAAIQLADLLEPANVRQSQALLNATPPADLTQSTQLLDQALATGIAIDNARVQSFALGKLGNLQERAGQYEAALVTTQKARLEADQGLDAKDSLYLWAWQMGRIFRAQGNLTGAAQSYSQAIALLEQIRSDILNANRDLQFDFRDTVEPIYRQYAALNLREVPSEVLVREGEQAFDEIDTTLVTLDSLKVAELQSYFANDCVITPVAARVDAVGSDNATAVISTAILGVDEQIGERAAAKPSAAGTVKQLAVIMSLPDGRKKISQTVIDEQEMSEAINQFRRELELGRSEYISDYDYTFSQRLYQWLIAPFEEDLAGVETLVFVNDGLLRSVPMAALHDGDRYLIEKFAVATTPSLTLTEPEKVKRPASLSALLMGVSTRPEVPGSTFGALPSVEQELSVLAEQLPNSETLLNEDFSLAALRQQLAKKDYRILHMATHGTFGFDPADNFVVAGAKRPGTVAGEDRQVNETLTISELDELIRSASGPTREPIELLTLTACETAIGDNRSTLGLAGVAIRAGVRSAIATLWSVSDESSAQLIAGFYDNLQRPEMTKAEALRKAQIAMIESEDFVNEHPYRWAPFTLIGNWL